MNVFHKRILLPLSISSVLFSGCATTTLLEKEGYKTSTQTRNVNTVLITDNVIAFAKPATQVPGLPQNSVVIVGQQHSYILTQGGSQFIQVISRLNPAHIKINHKLQFFSE